MTLHDLPPPEQPDPSGPTVPARLVGRLMSLARKAPGSAPGTLVHTGSRKVERVRIRLIDYDTDFIEERTLSSIEEGFGSMDDPQVSWINVDGLHDVQLMEAVAGHLGIHRLALEDVLSTSQRPKIEPYDNHWLIILKMLSFDEESESVVAEQVSLIVSPTYLLSFQERWGDVFEPVRERLRHSKGRIRSRGTDYLAYALCDAIVDRYFNILETVGDRVEALEETALATPTIESLHRIHHLKREMLILRRAVWPLREALGTLYRGEAKQVTEETLIYFRDVYDHAVQAIDMVETLREVLSGAMDLYMSGVSNRMNEVMKVLTIIATIFIPLSFFAGLYGMNFQNMPELSLPWAYPALLVFMAAIAGGMLLYFKKKGWL